MPDTKADNGLGSLAFRQTEGSDAEAWAAIKALLADVFALDFTRFDALGLRDPTSKSFSYFDAEGRCVANISAFELPLILEGKEIRAFGLQSGAVCPKWRGCGLYRDLTQRVLEHCETRGAELVLLYTATPALYTPWGFAVIPEHSFIGEAPRPAPPAASRRISLDSPEDIALLRRLLATRNPVSSRFGLLGHGTMFLFNSLHAPDIRLDYIPVFDAVIASRCEGDTFTLIDIIATHIPSLAEVLAALGVRPDSVEVLFPPDRLNWSGTPVACRRSNALMGRGAGLSRIAKPVMLPPMAAF